MVEEGSIFYTTSDTETIVKLIAKSKDQRQLIKLLMLCFKFRGICIIYDDTKYSYWSKRSLWNRPLVIGKLKNSYVFASETCTFDIIGAKLLEKLIMVKLFM